jgi:hypothetical protein
MATKKELEDQVSILKDEIRKLRGEAKATESTIEGLDHEAFGVFLVDKTFNLVKIKYDPETKKAAIDEVKDLGKSLVMASSAVKKAVIDTLIEIDKGRG